MQKTTLMAFAVITSLGITAVQAQPLMSETRDLTPYAARKMIEACMAQAARDQYPVALAVTDSAGNLVSFETMDGPMAHTGLTAQLKAKTAAVFRRSTAEMYERSNNQINRAPEWQGGFPIPGGFPVVAEGEVVGGMGAGAAGLSGGKVDDCVTDAIASVFGDGDGPPPPSLQPLLVTRKVLTSGAARQIVDACIAYAEERKYTGLGVAVVDPDADVLAVVGTEGASKGALGTAELKAQAAARWRRPTIELWDRINNQANRAPEFLGDFAQPGGYPIFIEGKIVGAIGGGGAVGDRDDECALAGLKAVFPMASTTSTP